MLMEKCDRCGAVYEPNDTPVPGETTLDLCSTRPFKPTKVLDLCDKCRTELADWLRAESYYIETQEKRKAWNPIKRK